MRGKSKTNYLISLILFLSLFLPMIAMVWPAVDIAPGINEKRRLADRPEFNLASHADFPGQFEAYFNDHFGFRNLLLQVTNLIKLKVFNVSGSSKVLAGKDGWLYYNYSSPVTGYSYENHIGLLPSQHETLFESIRRELEIKKSLVEQAGAKYLFVITPSKWTIYPEYLPDGYRESRRKTNVDALVDYLQKTSHVDVLDLRPLLLDAKKDGEHLFYRYDSHWNQLGAFYGYQGLAHALAKKFPAIVPRKIEDFIITNDGGGGGRDLAGMLGLQNYLLDTTAKLTPRTDYGYVLARSIGKYGGSIEVYQRDKLNLPKALMFRDSFSTLLLPTLTDHFSSIAYLWRNWDGQVNIYPMLIQFKPDIVIEQRAERYLVPVAPTQ